MQDIRNTPISSPTLGTNFLGPMSPGPIKQATGKSFEFNDNAKILPVEEQLWYPVPPPPQHKGLSRTGTPTELAGDTYIHEHHPGMAEVSPLQGARGGFVGDPFAGSAMGGAAADSGDEKEEKGMM